MKVLPAESHDVMEMSAVNGENPSSTRHGDVILNEKKGAVISFHYLCYTVQVKPPGKKCGSVDKEILHNVNGIFKPGMNAILGPTGSGKSSLLDLLAGRKYPKGIDGLILVDGAKQPKNFKCMAGYVVQDDVVMGTLTVKENFMFSANLRLPASISKKEKQRRVEEIIQELGLTSCADSKVGTEFIRGVSGGERKRTNIGMELIISPRVLFLDEPTTGLDASTANAVVTLLHRLSRRGRTIIFSIHQPRYSIFKQIDSIMLLASGYTIYHGPAVDALSFFSSIGYQCEEHNNPPDFFLDVVNGDSTAVKLTDVSNKPIAVSNGNEEAITLETGTENNLASDLHQKYIRSSWFSSIHDELAHIHKTYEMNLKTGEAEVKDVHYVTTFFQQLRVLSVRMLLNLFRNPQTSVMQLVTVIVMGLVVGLIFFQLTDTLPEGIQNRVGALFFIVVNQAFSNMSAVELFIKERVIFIHENASGFYRVSAYFFAKVFFDVIPLRLIPQTFYVVITYFMLGLQMNAGKFFFFFLDLFLTTLSASAISFAISATVGVFAIANLLISLVYVIMMVFSGLIVNIPSMPVWIRWLQWLSLMRYSLKALSINEMANLTFCYDVPQNIPVNNTVHCDIEAGNRYLEQQGIAYETAWDLWQNELALALFVLVFLTLTYIQLRRIKKLK